MPQPTTKSAQAKTSERLRRQGFDKAHVSNGSVSVGCSQCQALVINGLATHERGCPNQKRDHDD